MLKFNYIQLQSKRSTNVYVHLRAANALQASILESFMITWMVFVSTTFWAQNLTQAAKAS